MIPAPQRQVLRDVAAREPSAAAAAVHLDAVSQLLSKTLPELERAVIAAAHGPAPLEAACRHLLESGGKRVRPLACLLMTTACGGDPHRAVPVAAAAELIHSATLLHDDVIDEGEERRGRPAARALWGNLVSVLSGDLLLTRALQLVDGAHVEGVMQDMLTTLERLVCGEVAQLSARGRTDLGADGYFEIVRGKTASLFGFACRSGARIGGRADLVGVANDFGERIGLSFQIIDDVLDLAGEPARVGKMLGADLAEGKTTLPLALALDRDEKGELARLLPPARAGDENAARDLSSHPLVRAACDEARRIAAQHSHVALEALNALPTARARELLRELSAALTRRQA